MRERLLREFRLECAPRAGHCPLPDTLARSRDEESHSVLFIPAPSDAGRRIAAGRGVVLLARALPEWLLAPDRADRHLEPGGREPDLASGLHRPLDAGRDGRSRVRQRSRRLGNPRAGRHRGVRRRYRRAAVGEPLQPLPHDSRDEPGRVGLAYRRSGDGLHLRPARQRPLPLPRPRRKPGLVGFSQGRARSLRGLRRPDRLPGDRRGPDHRQHEQWQLGQPGHTPASLLRLRQANRRGAVDVDAGRHHLRPEHAIDPDRHRDQQPALADHR